MSDFGTLVTTLSNEAHVTDAAVLKHHIVSALYHFRGKRYRFSEAAGTFSTVADQAEYQAGVGGVPAAIFEIDALRLASSSSAVLYTIERVPLLEMRERQTVTNAGGYPDTYCWHHERLILWPTPSSVMTIHIDHLLDATLDEVGGAAITVASADTETNEFFRRGEEMLRSRVLATYHAARGDRPDLAAIMKGLSDDAERSLKAEKWQMAPGASLQAPFRW